MANAVSAAQPLCLPGQRISLWGGGWGLKCSPGRKDLGASTQKFRDTSYRNNLPGAGLNSFFLTNVFSSSIEFSCGQEKEVLIWGIIVVDELNSQLTKPLTPRTPLESLFLRSAEGCLRFVFPCRLVPAPRAGTSSLPCTRFGGHRGCRGKASSSSPVPGTPVLLPSARPDRRRRHV